MTKDSQTDKLKKVKKMYSFWGRFPSLYSAQDIITFLGRAKTIRSRAVKKIGLKRGDKALEVACGSGRNFPYIIDAVGKDGFILGFDYSQEMLDAAKQLQAEQKISNVLFQTADAEKTPFNDEYFDVAYSRRGPTPYREIHRVLKKSGCFVEIGIGEKDAKELKEVFGRGQNFGGWDKSVLDRKSVV